MFTFLLQLLVCWLAEILLYICKNIIGTLHFFMKETSWEIENKIRKHHEKAFSHICSYIYLYIYIYMLHMFHKKDSSSCSSIGASAIWKWISLHCIFNTIRIKGEIQLQQWRVKILMLLRVIEEAEFLLTVSYECLDENQTVSIDTLRILQVCGV